MNTKKLLYGVVAAALSLVSVSSLTSCDSIADPFSNDISGKEALATPAITSTNISANSIRLEWNKVEGASQYAIQAYNADGELLNEAVTQSTHVNVNALDPESEYKYCLTALAPVTGADKKASQVASITVKTSGVTFSEAHSDPEVTITWDGFGSNVSGYNISILDAYGNEIAKDEVTTNSYKYTATEVGNYSLRINGYYYSNDAYYWALAKEVKHGFKVESVIKYPFDIQGTIYLLGKGTEIDGTLHAEKLDDGTVQYSIKEWYGTGSKTLKFTLDSNGYMDIASNVLQYSGSYTYYYTGLADSDVSYLSGYKGYDTAGVYDKDELDNNGAWVGLPIITPNKGFYIYVNGYYGPYSSDPWGYITDPKGNSYWTFETK